MKGIRVIFLGVVFTLLFACNVTVNDDGEKGKVQDSMTEAADKKDNKKQSVQKSGLKKTVLLSRKTKKITKPEPTYKVNFKTSAVLPIDGDDGKKVVLLTIDDAPDECALEMAKTLERLKAPAIFFVNGHFFKKAEKKKVVAKIHEMGFAIGNHTYGHSNLSHLTKSEQKSAIVKVNRMVENVTGETPQFFRAPFGARTDYSTKLANQLGMTVMNWTYGYDWVEEYQNAASLTHVMLNTPLLRDGANLLMHDRKWTAKAIEDIVMGLRAKGFDFVDPDKIKTPDS